MIVFSLFFFFPRKKLSSIASSKQKKIQTKILLFCITITKKKCNFGFVLKNLCALCFACRARVFYYESINQFPFYVDQNPKTTSDSITKKHKQFFFVATAFPFSADDKESNSSSGGDGKGKSSSTMAVVGSNNSNNSSKSVNSNFNDSTTTDKANSTNKSTSSAAAAAVTAPIVNNEQANSEKSENNCDASSDVIKSVIDTSGIKVEIKDDPDAPKSVNNIQPALGGSLLPQHAANAKHPVSITHISVVYICLHASMNFRFFRWFKHFCCFREAYFLRGGCVCSRAL
jgi:hypothetical protein